MTNRFIQIFCVLTVRIYRSELRASERTEEYYDSMKEHMDEEYDTRPVYPLIEKQDFERDTPGEDAQPQFYESRSAIYSKISRKKNLKKSNTLKLNEDNLHPPAHSIQSSHLLWKSLTMTVLGVMGLAKFPLSVRASPLETSS